VTPSEMRQAKQRMNHFAYLEHSAYRTAQWSTSQRLTKTDIKRNKFNTPRPSPEPPMTPSGSTPGRGSSFWSRCALARFAAASYFGLAAGFCLAGAGGLLRS